jgi:hypothetical protein
MTRNTFEQHSLRDLLAALYSRLRQAHKPSQPADPEGPEDPYAYVGAPKKPRYPGRSAAAAAPLE